MPIVFQGTTDTSCCGRGSTFVPVLVPACPTLLSVRAVGAFFDVVGAQVDCPEPNGCPFTCGISPQPRPFSLISENTYIFRFQLSQPLFCPIDVVACPDGDTQCDPCDGPEPVVLLSGPTDLGNGLVEVSFVAPVTFAVAGRTMAFRINCPDCPPICCSAVILPSQT